MIPEAAQKSCSSLAVSMEQRYEAIERDRKCILDRLRNMVVSAESGHRVKRIRVDGVRVLNGRVWLYGPVKTKAGWHARRCDVIPATLPFTVEGPADAQG